ncbi:hypothetical protein V7S43_015913 [Phytophthora oleae]|uniref:Uncharacterized protein n=1 Tax=Phytophthora oleae TaxID=2107226 RepID=A0ABD3EYS4_9STRA
MFEGNKTDVFNGNNVGGVKTSDEEIDSFWTEIDTLVDSTMVNRDELETVRCVVQHFRKLVVFFLRSQKGASRLKQLQYNQYRRFDLLDVVMDCPTN